MKNITVETVVRAPIETVWEFWTMPQHIQNWNFASSDWECPYAENDLRVGGKFLARMAAKDGSAGFDFTGVYTQVVPYERIAYKLEDGRGVLITFTPKPEGVHVEETFALEDENSEEVQRAGWQAILNTFTQYVERV